MLTIPVTILSTVYMILLAVAYFSKERITNSEIKIYSNMIKLSCVGIILDTISALLVVYNMTDSLSFYIVTKLIFMYYIMWSGLFLIYTYIISFKKQGMNDKEFVKHHKNILKNIFIAFIICTILVPLMPLEYKMQDGNIYPFGLSVDITYFVAGFLSMILMLILMIFNHKNIKSKQYVPVYLLIILFLITVFIQKINPGLILTTSVECFITFLMYFTVENPDVQMIRELYKNKKIIEKSNEDTSRFVFRITQDIKNPIKQLIETTNALKNETDPDKIKEQIQYINSYSNQLDYLVNKSLNISNLDTQKIKIYETRYNSNNLFNEINYHLQKVINENVKFNFTIDKNIPKYLYGDTIKLKQAITALLLESAKHTKEGFINLDISAIIKYNVCRLMIQIEDSGEGMDIEQVNNILSLEQEDLEQIDIDNIEENEIGLKAIKKIITILGGSLLVKSRPNEGTTFNVVLDQKIVEIKDNDINRKLENYEQNLYNNKKILVIDEDEKELAKITSLLEENDAKVSSSVYERDCIEKIRSKVKFDLIILDDEMPNYSAIDVLKELKQIEGFKTPVIVMINDNKEGIKLQYLKDGFADYIMKSKLESEIKRIVKRF